MHEAATGPKPRSNAGSGGGSGDAVGAEARTLVFFDIDGTLLLSGGAGRAALTTSLQEVFETAGPTENYTFHGKTDPQIVVDLLNASGWHPDEIWQRMPMLWPVYLEALGRELDQRVQNGLKMQLPGVEELLAELEASPDVTLGLLTGNIEPAANLKLAASGVRASFEVGGFGSDSAERNEIAKIAVERARSLPRLDGAPLRMVVVGDTPADVEAAQAVGARAVAVATGRHTTDELAEAGADVVFSDFSDTGGVVQGLTELGRVTPGEPDAQHG